MDVYRKLKRLGEKEISDHPDTTLPDPTQMPYTVEDWEWGYSLWALWSATGKRFLLSDLIGEIRNGYGKAWDIVLDIEGFYSRTKTELEQNKDGG